jgi:hypothetical protein
MYDGNMYLQCKNRASNIMEKNETCIVFVMFLYTLYWCDINMTNSIFHYDDETNANFDIYFKYSLWLIDAN